MGIAAATALGTPSHCKLTAFSGPTTTCPSRYVRQRARQATWARARSRFLNKPQPTSPVADTIRSAMHCRRSGFAPAGTAPYCQSDETLGACECARVRGVCACLPRERICVWREKMRACVCRRAQVTATHTHTHIVLCRRKTEQDGAKARELDGRVNLRREPPPIRRQVSVGKVHRLRREVGRP